MQKRMFRLLRADEIDCRISTVSAKGVSVLLYKDARCDMNILDETVGAYNWQKHYSRDNANCTVSIWDAEKGQWISKEDTGTESFTEKEKGLASDSFKRACFNWGIGRELYSAPFIWIPAGTAEVKPHPKKQGEYTCYDKFTVSEIGYDEQGRINRLVLKKKNSIAYEFGRKSTPAERAKAAGAVVDDSADTITRETFLKVQAALMNRKDKFTPEYVCQFYGISALEELTEKQGRQVLATLMKVNGNE